ncbi:hypothetical protein HOA91_01020 [Candidatus Woesearchaeota archaeon]|jgi:hypothetical protein|nr:hypothetical protein [Candidatus Woesearchaeota archaeon]
MNKKAASVIMITFEILVVLLVVYMTVSIGKAYGESDQVTKINAAEELRMMIDTLVAVPGDAIVNYPQEVSKFSFILTQGSISVFNKGEEENVWIVTTFFLPDNYQAEGSVSEANYICLEKLNKKIILKKCLDVADNEVPPQLGSPDSSGIYTYDAGILATSLYYRYQDGSWEWSPDKINWMSVNTIVVSGGEFDKEKPVQENQKLIRYLQKFNPPVENE